MADWKQKENCLFKIKKNKKQIQNKLEMKRILKKKNFEKVSFPNLFIVFFLIFKRFPFCNCNICYKLNKLHFILAGLFFCFVFFTFCILLSFVYSRIFFCPLFFSNLRRWVLVSTWQWTPCLINLFQVTDILVTIE